jgi:hypothetical protein
MGGVCLAGGLKGVKARSRSERSSGEERCFSFSIEIKEDLVITALPLTVHDSGYRKDKQRAVTIPQRKKI